MPSSVRPRALLIASFLSSFADLNDGTEIGLLVGFDDGTNVGVFVFSVVAVVAVVAEMNGFETDDNWVNEAGFD